MKQHCNGHQRIQITHQVVHGVYRLYSHCVYHCSALHGELSSGPPAAILRADRSTNLVDNVDATPLTIARN